MNKHKYIYLFICRKMYLYMYIDIDKHVDIDIDMLPESRKPSLVLVVPNSLETRSRVRRHLQYCTLLGLLKCRNW